jgi:FkbM family methyltransferase
VNEATRYNVALNAHDRKVSFTMNHDAAFPADNNTRLYAQIGCEPEVTHLMMRVLKEGDTAVDVGANVGFFTCLMAKLVGPAGEVIAFEPHHDTARRCLANLDLNDLHNVELFQHVTWDCVRDLTFYTLADTGECCLAKFESVTGSQTIRSKRLDSLQMLPKLVKIDVEGAELYTLKGAAAWLANSVPFILAELSDVTLSRFGQTPTMLREYMLDAGYHTFLPRPDGTMPLLVPPRTKIVNGPGNLMVLFATIDQVATTWPEFDVGAKPGP